MKFNLTSPYQTRMWALLISILMIRLLFLGAYPLSDTTEARYSEMGRLIVETGDWITPQIEKGTPFWGKPPLSFWLTAASFKIFGINEFSARLPSFFLGLAVIGMVFGLGLFQADQKKALTACVVMASSILFWISSGAVMTDHCLLAGTTLSMVAFWRCIAPAEKQNFGWGILFFVGLSIGLMAKGPVAAVLIFLPIFVWACIQKKPVSLMQKLPWKSGILITVLLCLPWYVAAELKTPGFLEYFIIGEHWNRFLVPGWKGDLYGSAHSQPKGMIWVFWVICALPWSFFLPFLLRNKARWKAVIKMAQISNGWYSYLAIWAAAPLIFFTMAGNILWAYVLPGIPAFALLAAEIFSLSPFDEKNIIKISGAMTALFLAASIVVFSGIGPQRASQKEMIARFNGMSDGGSLNYLYDRPYSAEFYSRGTAGEIKSVSRIMDLFENDKIDYLAARESFISSIPQDILSRFEKKERINRYVLLKEKNETLKIGQMINLVLYIKN
jgi:4-amino-4-deoxy-L-arabinose transferase-like glycosyltransferase